MHEFYTSSNMTYTRLQNYSTITRKIHVHSNHVQLAVVTQWVQLLSYATKAEANSLGI